MDFRLLGLLEVSDAGRRVAIGRGRESELLALLLLHPNEPLPSERIVEELWGADAPENGTKSVQIYVSRLRKALDSDRIETTPAGYRIQVLPGELDIQRFERLAGEQRFTEALALWHGDALADFRYAGFALDEARRLDELRDRVVSDLLDERLARGEGEQAIPELEALIERAPLWERPRGQLMRALYLAGRQADALEVYRSTRALLADELGVDPGPELQRLERAILNQDPELGVPARPTRALTRRRGRSLLIVGGALVAVAAVAAAIVLSTGDSTELVSIRPNSVAAIDPRTDRLVAQVGAGNRPSRLADSGRRLWVMSAGDGTISEIDTAREQRIGTFGPELVPTDLAATPTTLWVGSAPTGAGVGTASVARYDAFRHARTHLTPLPSIGKPPGGGRRPEERYLVVGGGAVWAIGPDLAPVKLNPQTGRVEQVVPDVAATSLTFGNGALWAADGRSVVEIDPRTARVLQSIPVTSLFDLQGIAAGGGVVWASSPAEGLVWRIDPGPPKQVSSIHLAYGASSIAYGDGAVWVANSYDDTVDRIDPQTRAVRRVASIPAPQDIAVDNRHVWVASGAASGRSGGLTSSACDPVSYSGPGRPDLLIASDLPLQGGGAAVSQAAVDTIRSVLAQRSYRAGRFRVGYQSCDDSTPAAGGFDDGQCSANAATYASDRTVVGVIGPSDSFCALDEIPLANRAPHGPLAMVSPFNTGPFLTRRGLGGAATSLTQFYAGGLRNYARTIGADHIQVAAAAVLARRLGVRRIAVVFNRDGMLQQKQEQWFIYAARRIGGMQAVPLLWNGGQQELADGLRRLRVDGAFLVSYVGDPSETTSTATTLGNVLRGRPVIVTDTFGPWSAATGSHARFYATLAGLTVPAQLPARTRSLLQRLPDADRIPFAVAQSAAAADVVLRAIAKSDGTRRSVVQAVRRTNVSGGFTGRLRLDQWGDPGTAPVTVFRLGGARSNASELPYLDGGTVVATITPPLRAVPAG